MIDWGVKLSWVARKCRDGFGRENILHAKNFCEKTSEDYYLTPISVVQSDMQPFMHGDDDGILISGVIISV